VTVVVVVALTTWLSVLDVLASHPALPVKTAVIEWVPAASDEVENVALPVVVLTATPEARVVVPSLKAIVPRGTPFVEVTVAVKVTDAPEFDGFAEDATEFEVAI
jgi:hypothetical protein